jgi:hypothetical protein
MVICSLSQIARKVPPVSHHGRDAEKQARFGDQLREFLKSAAQDVGLECGEQQGEVEGVRAYYPVATLSPSSEALQGRRHDRHKL